MTTKPLQKKSQASQALMDIISALKTACNEKVQIIQADWGGEFRNEKLETELMQRGTIKKETVPHHSETNPVVERANRTIFTMNRTIIAASRLPNGMWDKASLWSTYVKNRIPHKTLKGASPIKIMFPETHLQEQRRNLRKFGEKVRCFDYSVSDKLSPRFFEGRIIGYTHSHGIYQVLDKKGGVKLAKNPRPIQDEEESESLWDTLPENPHEDSEPIDTTETVKQEPATTPETPDDPPPAPRKPRNRKNWPDIVGRREPSTRIKRPTWKARTGAVGTDQDHPTDQQARNSPQAKEWAIVRQKERAQLEKYNVFTRVKKDDIPTGAKIVDTKWVYVIKRQPDGSIETYKVRNVGRGFTREHGVNYDKTYSQMMRPETFKILLVIALYYGWDVRQWDVVAEYLQALLRHDIYISDINEEGEIEYWLLQKALYGLKQSGYEWYQLLIEILKEVDLEQCLGDKVCFTTKSGTTVGTHVDDLLGIGPKDELDHIESGIEERVELDKRGKPAKMLGVELSWGKDYVLLT